ncbi:hypothetical protein GQ457_04G022450 [Hibiscus cannabinus]
MASIAMNYFQHLFTSSSGGEYDQILDGISPCITSVMNCSLRREFTTDDVLAALKTMSPHKVAGVDGLGVVFYQQFWHIVAEEVGHFCIDLITRLNLSIGFIIYTLCLFQKDSRLSHNDGIFKHVWQLQCPKIRIATWKFMHNFNPTKYNLCIKRVAINPMCFRCNRGVENSEHVFQECSYAASIWHHLNIFWPNHTSQLCFKELLAWFFENNTNQKRIEIVVTLWALWYSRNKLCHEGVTQSKEDFLTFVRSFCLEIHNLRRLNNSLSLGSSASWITAPTMMAKINFDDSYCQSHNTSISGIVVRDESGYLLGACHQSVSRVHLAFAAKAFAAVHGLSFVVDLGLQLVVLEGDARAVITNQSSSRSFWLLSFSPHSTRSANQVAHSLAREGLISTHDRFWIQDVLPLVMVLVAADWRSLDPL